MASLVSSSLGVPILLLREAEGHPITIELKGGEMYRGMLGTAEGTMNVQLSNVIHTARDGRVTKLENVYLRGNQIRFIVLPDILKNAPLFKKVADFASAKAKPLNLGRGRGRGRGRGAGGAAGRGRGGGGRGAPPAKPT